MTWIDLFLRLGAAILAGGLIGFERQWRNRMAGLRTNALVGAGAALFVLLASLTASDDPRGLDPTRIAAQVVSGIGFLGAGVIIRDGINVRGVNTAATLWCAAATGALAGAGFPLQAVAGAVVVLAVNVVLRPVGRRIDRTPLDEGPPPETTYHFRATCRDADEAHVRALLLQALAGGEYRLHGLESRDLDDTGKVEVAAELTTDGRHDGRIETAASRLSLEPSVTAVRWQVEPVL